MKNEKLYSADEICKELNITIWTLSNWYRWETKQLNDGTITERYLPQPIHLEHTKGKPRRWTYDMLTLLKQYKSNVVVGRNGIFGTYTNPVHKETKKYKQSLTQ